MASQKQIFLVSLLLTIALGCHGGKKCFTNKDCPPCKFGTPLCADGVCGCLDIKTDDDVAQQNRKCFTNKDCPPCKFGTPLCADGVCDCLDIKTDDDVAQENRLCKVDKDCAKQCNGGCKYNCIDNICFCTC